MQRVQNVMFQQKTSNRIKARTLLKKDPRPIREGHQNLIVNQHNQVYNSNNPRSKVDTIPMPRSQSTNLQYRQNKDLIQHKLPAKVHDNDDGLLNGSFVSISRMVDDLRTLNPLS